MAKHRRNAMPPLPSKVGGYEFEVVQPGPPVYSYPPPAVKARGGLIPAGDGEGLPVRPAPPLDRERPKQTKRSRGGKSQPVPTSSELPLVEFTVVLKDRPPAENGNGVVTVRGHKLKWIRSRREADGGVFAVVQHSPAGDLNVALFHKDDVLAVFNGTFQPTGAG